MTEPNTRKFNQTEQNYTNMYNPNVQNVMQRDTIYFDRARSN